MNRAGGFFLAALLAGSGFAQNITRSFGSVVFPGGTSATNPNITRTFGSVVFPGGSPTSPVIRTAPAPVVGPVFNGGNTFYRGGNSFYRGGNGIVPGNRGGNRRNQPAAIYSYPVYVPGYYDPAAAYGDPMAPMTAPQPTQPNVTVVYPQQQQQEVRPIIIQLGSDANGQVTQTSRPASAAIEEPSSPEPADQPHYLIAFKDHTIYSSVAYWFDGDTLHYFTTGDTHNQVSVALIDRALTERLNRELGIDFKMPPAK